MRGKDCEYAQNKLQEVTEDILERIKGLEAAISGQLEPFKQHKQELLDYGCLLKYGLQGYRDRILQSQKENRAFNPQAWTYEVMQKHPELRFPHRKILDFLSKLYHYEKKEFMEVNMSTLVRGCRLGKNRVKDYLKLLENKGLVRQRSDGYRVWYKVNTSSF